MRRPKSWLKQKPNRPAAGLEMLARELRLMNSLRRASERLLRQADAAGVSSAELEKFRLQVMPPISDERIQELDETAAAYRRHPNAKNWKELERARKG